MSNYPEFSFPVRNTNTKSDLGLQMREVTVEFSLLLFLTPRNSPLSTPGLAALSLLALGLQISEATGMGTV